MIIWLHENLVLFNGLFSWLVEKCTEVGYHYVNFPLEMLMYIINYDIDSVQFYCDFYIVSYVLQDCNLVNISYYMLSETLHLITT